MKNEYNAIDVSVIIPCLNEEAGIGVCIDKINEGMNGSGIVYEIIVSDNGSTDNSRSIAAGKGAIVIEESRKGYGSAYLAGIKACKGKWIVMGDGDDSYDFRQIKDFIEPLKNGYDLVMGSRFQGKMHPGSMSWSHRYIGNPILSSILRFFFHTKISDSHCGYRALTRTAFETMKLKTPGMEFASEMVVNAIKERLKIKEIPIDYYPRIGDSKLESIKDAWRHMRFMLLYAPNYLYLVPGLPLLLTGLFMVIGLVNGPVTISTITLDFHFNILGMVFTLLGVQVITLGIFSRVFSFLNGFDRFDKKIAWFVKSFRLEKGIILGGSLAVTGFVLFLTILIHWIATGFGPLFEIRRALLAATLSVTGIQTIFSSFFLSFLILEKRS